MKDTDKQFMVPIGPSADGPMKVLPPSGLQSPIMLSNFTLKKRT